MDAQALEVLVVDSGAIIRGHGTNFHRHAKRFVTVQEVLSEVRDSKSRDLLSSLPYELEIRSPSDEAMAAVAQFSRKSGDFAALSLTDLKLIALTYTLEKETTGGHQIRTEPPKMPRIVQPQRTAPTTEQPSMPRRKGKRVVESSAEEFGEGLPGSSSPLHRSEASEEEEELDGDDRELKEGLIAQPQDSESRDLTPLDEDDSESVGAVGEEDEAEEESEHENDDEDEDDDEDEEDDEEEDEYAGEGEGVLDLTARVSSSASGDASASALFQGEGEATISVFQESDFPSLGGGAPKVGLPTSSNWIAVAKKDADKPFEVKPPRKEPQRILAQALSHFVDVVPLKATDTKTVISELQSRALEPSKIIGGSGGYSEQATARAAAEDDGEGWINSSNFRSALESGGPQFRDDKKRSKAVAKEESVSIACVTTDFSMQNVMLQMGLHIVSVDGMVVRSVKQWVLRCIGCEHIHYQMDRLFCEKCGGSHMSRVSCSIDSETGHLKLHLKKNYQPNLRGKIHSLPKPGKQGRYEGELLLSEDQLLQGIWLQKKLAVQRNLKSAFGEDVATDVGLHINKGVRIKVGLGSRNPNADKGRERRGKAKRK